MHQDDLPPQGYSLRDRVSAGVLCAFFVFLAAVMADIVTNGAVSARLGGAAADEAERYTREAVQ